MIWSYKYNAIIIYNNWKLITIRKRGWSKIKGVGGDVLNYFKMINVNNGTKTMQKQSGLKIVAEKIKTLACWRKRKKILLL